MRGHAAAAVHTSLIVYSTGHCAYSALQRPGSTVPLTVSRGPREVGLAELAEGGRHVLVEQLLDRARRDLAHAP